MAVTIADALLSLRPLPGLAVLMCDVAGSGKTTFAMALEDAGFLRLSIDEELWRRHGRYGLDFPAADYPALLEPGAYGPLPKIGADGRTAIRAYARGHDRTDNRPRVGLIVGGLGMNQALTEETIRRLPGAVTLAFSPYATRIALLLDRARDKGMEMLVSLPLEPTGYPLNNPGDRGLLTGLTPGA